MHGFDHHIEKVRALDAQFMRNQAGEPAVD